MFRESVICAEIFRNDILSPLKLLVTVPLEVRHFQPLLLIEHPTPQLVSRNAHLTADLKSNRYSSKAVIFTFHQSRNAQLHKNL